MLSLFQNRIFSVLALIFSLMILQGTLLVGQVELDKVIEINSGPTTIQKFLEKISDQDGILFSYSSQQINASKELELDWSRKRLSEILEWLKTHHQIDHVLVENQIVLKQRGKEEMMQFDGRLYSVSGYLYDASSGESLIGAVVIVEGTEIGTITNAFGYYSISLPEGKYELSFSYIAFDETKIWISLDQHLNKSVFLNPSRIILPEILIKSNLRQHLLQSSQMSRLDIDPEQLEQMPEFGGEVGLIKGLQTLPGIKSHSDGSAFFFVRGGAKDQNLIIIDDAPVYNPSHLFGYYSMVIPDFTKDIKVYKSDMPVHLGDRLSSIIDIRTKDGNLNDFHLTGMLNPIVSRFSLEGPIVKGKSSFFTSFRASNFQWLYRNFVPNLNFGFSDFNFKWNYRPGRKNRFYFNFFFGSDLLANTADGKTLSGISWNNMASSFRWNHIVNSKTFVNTVLIGSIYQYQLQLGGNRWRSNIGNLSLKTDLSYYPRPDLNFHYGLNVSNHGFDPGSLTLEGSTKIFPTITFGKSAEVDLYGKANHKLNDRFSYTLGFRMPFWNNTGPTILYLYDDDYQLRDTVGISNNESYKSFIHFDPRLSLSYTIDSSSSLKFSYGAYHQYIHLLSNSTSPFTSIEVWLPSGLNIKPQRADQIAIGYSKLWNKLNLEFTAELYYKFMQNQIEYEAHADLLLNPLLEGELRYGKANAYGLELLLQRKKGRMNGWLSYSYSRVFRQSDDINDGKAYRAFRDRPHDLSIYANYSLTDRIHLSANWTYYTGSAITVPIGFYEFNDQSVPLYGEKNNGRLPDYHRLDLSLRYILNKPEKWFKHSITFSMYNAYAHNNPISVNYNKIQNEGQLVIPTDHFGTQQLVFTQRDLLRIMPSISYKFEL